MLVAGRLIGRNKEEPGDPWRAEGRMMGTFLPTSGHHPAVRCEILCISGERKTGCNSLHHKLIYCPK